MSRHRPVRRRSPVVELIVQTAFLAGFGAALIMGWVLFWCGSAVGQEPDPLRMSFIAARVSVSPSGIAPVDGTERAWLMRIEGHAGNDPLTRYLAARGWILHDQMGADRYYRTRSGMVRVYCRMYTGRFMICRVVEDR